MQQKDDFQKLIQDDPSLNTVLRPYKERHPDVFQEFCDANKEAYPSIYEEILGIAHGAGIQEEDTLLLMLRPEIESLAQYENGTMVGNDNCFDIIFNPGEKEEGPAFIAHNEDWTPAYKPYGFVLHENMPFSPKGDAQHITAFTYPASPVGFTFGYNDKGLVTSCNGLNPIPCKTGKGRLGRYFINRDILAAPTVKDAIKRLEKAAPNSALGFGMSIGSVGSHELYHAEMAPYDPKNPDNGKGYVDIIKIKDGKSYLHSNKYTHDYFLDNHINQYFTNSTAARLARAAEMPAPVSPKLALDILGDEKNTRYPIYRHGYPGDPEELATISTALLDLDNALVYIYGGNPKYFDPVVVMPLYNNNKCEDDYSSSNNERFGLPFQIAAGVGGAFIVITIILLVVIVCLTRRRSHSTSINSGYRRVD